MNISNLNRQLGNIDLHLLDHVLKGDFLLDGPVLDAGCGEGRNLHFFLANGADVFIADKNSSAIKMVQMIAMTLKRPVAMERTFTGDIDEIPWNNFQTILCVNVFQHLSEDSQGATLNNLKSKLVPGGVLFLKMGLEDKEVESCIRENQLESWIEDSGLHYKEPLRIDHIVGKGTWATALLTKF